MAKNALGIRYDDFPELADHPKIIKDISVRALIWIWRDFFMSGLL